MICDKELLEQIVFKYRRKTKATVKLVEDLFESINGGEDLSDAFAVCENYAARAHIKGGCICERMIEDIAFSLPVCRKSAEIIYNAFMYFLPDLPLFEALMNNREYLTAEETTSAVGYARERYDKDYIDELAGEDN